MPHTHECGSDTAAYVLGALDDHELTAFRRHLDTCSVCQADVESLGQLTNLLPMSAPQYPASKQLRRQVMAEVQEDARAARLPTSAPVWKGLRGSSPAWSRSPGPRFHGGLVGAGVALALVLVVIIAGVSATHASKSGINSRVFHASIGSGEFVAASGQDQLIVHKLASLPASNRYEVWLVHGKGQPDPTRVLFNTSSTGDDAVKLPGDLLHGVTEVLVTEELKNGSSIPTGPVVLKTQAS
jgi:hypothetical protein